MNEKKSNGFAALILSVVVALVAVFGVKFIGGSAAAADPSVPDASVDGSGEQGDAGKYTAGTYTATAQGMGEITVTLTIGEDGSMADLAIETPGETPGIGVEAAAKMQESILTAQSADVDTVSGATITSKAVIAAVTDCLSQAAGGAGEGSGASGAYKAGVYTDKATGMGEITVTITVDDSGSISNVEIDASNETPGIGVEAAAKLQESILTAQSAEVDAISGATVTSNAVIQAVTSCLEQAAN